MKAILFSDLHCNNKQLFNLYELVIQTKEFDCLVFAGDVVNMGEPVWFMEKFVKVIDSLDLPFLWVPGNNDFGRAYHKLNAKYKSLEGRVETVFPPLSNDSPPARGGARGGGSNDLGMNSVKPVKFTGVGGSPASWAGQYQGESMINQKDISKSIFISHYPPPGLHHLEKFDQDWNKQSNNLTMKQFNNAPLVHICGHLHYRWGTAFLGQTKVIQLASLETGHYAILDLENLSVKFERF